MRVGRAGLKVRAFEVAICGSAASSGPCSPCRVSLGPTSEDYDWDWVYPNSAAVVEPGAARGAPHRDQRIDVLSPWR